MFWAGEGKSNHLQTAQSILRNVGLSSKGTTLPKPYLTWEKVISQLQSPLAFLSYLRGREKKG